MALLTDWPEPVNSEALTVALEQTAGPRIAEGKKHSTETSLLKPPLVGWSSEDSTTSIINGEGGPGLNVTGIVSMI